MKKVWSWCRLLGLLGDRRNFFRHSHEGGDRTSPSWAEIWGTLLDISHERCTRSKGNQARTESSQEFSIAVTVVIVVASIVVLSVEKTVSHCSEISREVGKILKPSMLALSFLKSNSTSCRKEGVMSDAYLSQLIKFQKVLWGFLEIELDDYNILVVYLAQWEILYRTYIKYSSCHVGKKKLCCMSTIGLALSI